MEITLTHYLSLSCMLFAIGIVGLLLNRQTLLGVLMSLEILLLAVEITFVSFGAYHHDVTGQIMTLFILTVAAAETAIGLAIIVVYYRRHKTIAVEDLSRLNEVTE